MSLTLFKDIKYFITFLLSNYTNQGGAEIGMSKKTSQEVILRLNHYEAKLS